MQCWLPAGVFEAIAHDLRMVLRLSEGRKGHPAAALLDSRTLPSTPESGSRAAYDGAKRNRGSRVNIAVDPLGHPLALHSTAANEQDRAQVAELAEQVQEVTGDSIEVAFVDQGYTGDQPAQQAAVHGLHLEVVRLPEATKAACCCPAAGWWSAVSPGQRASAAGLATPNGCQKPL